jgi:hypothetical protein
MFLEIDNLSFMGMAKSEPTPNSIPCKIDENVWTENTFFGCILVS